MPQLRISEVAELLAVSDDTVRRWVDAGDLPASTDGAGRMVVDGADVAAKAKRMHEARDPMTGRTSARNRFAGIVTAVASDTVMSQVELQCGPFRVVSLMSTEAVRELGLEPGSLAVAIVKATTVIVDAP